MKVGFKGVFIARTCFPDVSHGLAGEKSKSNGEFNILGMAVEEHQRILR